MKEYNASHAAQEASAPPAGYCPFNWTSVPITDIGFTTLLEATTLNFNIPSVIPSDAREVLILVAIFLTPILVVP